ncbi:hypothetical protein Pcinc_024970 [Petrolisthes cinctipes]|uniref:Uncharacterized protein n=1 Tax=Petrolisthes cinctipes TaxID=88211 RepID=A0AAE1F9F4_PETCI|nr:hypothetical protein Pcinc_024970 [Petrolisthes cinctipes]
MGPDPAPVQQLDDSTTSMGPDPAPVQQLEQPMTNDDFNITGNVIERQEPILETSLDDPDLDESLANDTPLTFEEVAGGTKRGGRMLLSSDGYSYTVKVKELSKQKLFRSPAAIVDEVMKEVIPEGAHSLPNPDNIARAANLHRQNLRTKEPKPDDVNFELIKKLLIMTFQIDYDYIKADEFLIGEVTVDSARHLLFSTKVQLQHLSKFKRWFMDGAFKLVKRLFYQLFSIHGFIRKDDDIKLVRTL